MSWPRSEEFKVSYFLTDNGQWNRDLLSQFVFATVVAEIIKIFIPSNGMPYKVFWGLAADGEYSVKSGVALL